MQENKELNRTIEMIATKAWPAEIKKPYGHWIVRANKGVSKRANSVLTVGDFPENKNWLNDIESFYRSINITPCFYITESSPAKLDRILMENHYEIDTKLLILEVESELIIEQVKEDIQLTVLINDEVTNDWMNSFMELEGHSEGLREGFNTILQGIQLKKGFFSLRLNDEVIAVATIAIESGWGYVSNVVVNEQFRRRGIASQLLLHLSLWAHQHDCEKLFMQVLENNNPALRLYEKLGFKQIAESYYRVKAN